MQVNAASVRGIAQLRRETPGEVFDYRALLDALSDYGKPRNRISRLLRQKAIIRVKKGLYCFGEDLRQHPVSREYLANLIYGPSYVSLEYALSFHGLIPERVEVVTSVTTRRSRSFETPMGGYSYRMITQGRYSIGAMLETFDQDSFLIASPEKAVVDKVWSDKRFSGLRVSAFDGYLFDDLRIDPEALRAFDRGRLDAIARAYDSAKINNLIRFLKRLGGPAHA